MNCNGYDDDDDDDDDHHHYPAPPKRKGNTILSHYQRKLFYSFNLGY